ncbi:MAG: MMPL family transporter [Deltaproteobacteria bacterium]|nr:MMPL family transporter [Deltaproteobacteria bacterium]
MQEFEILFGKWVVKQRWWLIVATVLLTLISAAGALRLELNNDSRIFFSKENPQLQALEALENTYNRIDNVLFILAPKDGNVFTRKTLAAVEDLTETLWTTPYSSRVDSITNFQHTRAAEDELVVEDLVLNAERLSDHDISVIKQVATAEPSLKNLLISPSGHVTGVNVNILLPQKSTEEAPEIAEFARKTEIDFNKKHPDIDTYLTGAIMFDTAFGEASVDDMQTLVPAMLAIILIIIGCILRSFAGTFATLVVILISMMTGMGLAGWLGISLNPASTSAPTIILLLAVADSVHILTTMFYEMRHGKSKHAAAAESLRVNLLPVFYTSATTAIGFLTMNFSDAPPFRDLGNMVALGVMAAFVYSVTALPAILVVLPLRIKPKTRHNNPSSLSFDTLANFIISRRKPFFWGALFFLLATTAGVLKIELDDDWIKYFDERYAIRRASDFGTENLRGFEVIEYSMDSGETGGINSPAYLNKLEAFAGWYRRQPGVIHVGTITDVFKRLNKNMHGDNETYYRIPTRRDLAAQYLLLYEMSLPFGLDLNSQIDIDKSATRMVVSIKDTTTRQLREMDEKAREWLRANAPEMLTYGSGISIMWAHISERNINSMLGASFLALVLISVLLMFVMRSFKLGLLSLIPNLSPALMGFGLWGYLFSQVGLGLSVVVAMTLGIVVDDTIHFMIKYLRARRELRLAPPEAVRYSFNTVGTAMLVTTISLVCGFLVLTCSGFKMNSEMGLLSAITIAMALTMDFLFLPTLLMKVDGKNQPDKGD